MKKIGIYNPYLESRGGGEKVCLALASILSKNPKAEVSLITHKPVDLRPLENYFNIDLSNVKVRRVNFDRWYLIVFLKLPILAGLKFFVIDLYGLRRLRKMKFDIFINNYYQSNLPNVGKYGVYMSMFPQKLTAEPDEIGYLRSLYKRFLAFLSKRFMYGSAEHGIYTYDKIIANSQFTQSYIKRYWDVDSIVLYPICEDMHDGKASKQKIISNVGRFFAFDKGSHHKRQDFLLDAFLGMKDLHKQGWELHFAGSIADDRRAHRFVAKLKAKAKGFPVFFHFDAPFKELKKLYNDSTIYWHATGFGSDPEESPEKQEHFGITTVEAMSAGAIPIVINTAGQKESVIQNNNGFLWNTEAELEAYSKKVAAMPKAKQAALQQQAIKDARAFGHEAFEKHTHAIFGKVIDS